MYFVFTNETEASKFKANVKNVNSYKELILSQPLYTIKWDEWELLNGPQNRMSTYTTKNLKKNSNIINE